MEGNKKYLHYQDLKEYYHCLEIINNENNLLSFAKDDLYWCESKLQEAQELVKPFGFTNQSINNLPQVNFYSTKINRIRIENILTSIKQNVETLTENDKLINHLIDRQDVNARDISSLSYKMEELEDKEKHKQHTYLFLLLGIISVFVIISFSESATGLALTIIILFILFSFFLPTNTNNRETIRDLKAQIDENQLIIDNLKSHSNQIIHEIKHIENIILKSISQLNEYPKLARQIIGEKENELKQTFNEKSINIRKVLNRISVSDDLNTYS